MQELQSYIQDRWAKGEGDGAKLHDPVTGEAIAHASLKGIDLGQALEHARTVGGPNLRAMSFAERGKLLGDLAAAIHAHRKELLDLSRLNTGTTHSDSKFDIDGATATLAAYAKIGESLGDRKYLLDGEGEQIGRSPRYWGQHIKVPLRGVAIHINAYNFPAWGYAEKLACAFLAGMPVVTKPATSTALPAYRIAQIVVDSGLLPAGAWSFLAGSVGDLLDHVQSQDVIAFTGSAATGRKIRSHQQVIAKSVRVNIEADSLNVMVVGSDVKPDGDTFDLFLRECAREMTQKTGQKCTATRRVLVPEALMDAVVEGLKDKLADYPVGAPTEDGVRVGPLSVPSQLQSVCEGLAELTKVADVAFGEIPKATDGPGAFVKPIILRARDADEAGIVNELEVFGPVVTLLPYDGSKQRAAELVQRGDGGLVATIYSDDLDFAGDLLMDIAPFHGRVLLGSKRVAEYSTGPGLVLPTLNHGGPGRAGGGQELGGLRGLGFYLQTCAVQGARPVLQKLLDA